ncbi:MAG: tetratricopeptide repeat protein [Paludibacteraceae bacterium]|nr:tetratricopeptide repeat protein [Paludibacteraceae bacterium]
MRIVESRKSKVERLLLTLAISLLPFAISRAQSDFDVANAAYADGRYEEAATLYQSLLDEQEDATLYYNLGNARFKQGELAQAILNYERALRLQPNNKDAQYNLAFAQSRITDNIVEQDFFLSAWARAIRNNLRERTWLGLSIGLFILGLVGLLLFLLGREPWIRKTAFHTAWLALLFSLITGLNAYSLHQRDTLRNEAIITQGVVNAKSSPDRSGTDLFTLHEGTKVTIRETLGEWCNIRVGNNEGWIKQQNMERI